MLLYAPDGWDRRPDGTARPGHVSLGRGYDERASVDNHAGQALYHRGMGTQWPGAFPNNCPPSDATPAAVEGYRLVEGDPPGPNDFLSKRERNPGIRFRDDWIECKACALSVYIDAEDAKRVRRIVGAMRHMKIAQGTVGVGTERILATPSAKADSHHSWWLPEDCRPWQRFSVIPDSS